jgi:Ca2+-binding EF-hand superfamily protein
VKGMIEEERIADAFDRLDVDQSGFISPDDLRDILCDYTKVEIQALIDEIDSDKDGQISFEEFKKIFRRNNQTLSGNVSGFFPNSEHMQTSSNSKNATRSPN